MKLRAILVAVVLFAAACSDDSGTEVGDAAVSSDTTTTTTTTAGAALPFDASDAAAFVIGSPVEGFELTFVEESPRGRTVRYDDTGCGSRDWQADVTVSPEFGLFAGRPGDHAPHVFADGTEVEVLDLWDDGRAYGFAASWELSDGRWVSVRVDGDWTVDDLRGALDTLAPIDDTEWARLLRVAGQDLRAVREGDVPSVHVVDAGEVDGLALTAEVLVPEDYPLGEEDCRTPCFSFTLGDTTSERTCSGSAERHELFEHRVLAGRIGPEVESVDIRPYEGMQLADPTPPTASYIDVPNMDHRIWFAVVAPDFCAWNIDTGAGHVQQGGLTPSDIERMFCVFD